MLIRFFFLIYCAIAFQTESLTDKDSSRSTQKSDTEFKLSVSQNTQLSNKKQSVVDSKFSKARYITCI